MNHCKTCVHWRAPDPRDHTERNMCTPRDPDTYEPMVRGFEVRVCKHPAQTFSEAPIERNGFGLADASMYFAVLVTAEEFGCVRHESEEPAP